jgi:hypothetical protein
VRAWPLLLVLALVACDPEAAPAGPFELLDEGVGDALLEPREPLDGATFSYFVDTRGTVNVTSNEGFLEHNGVELLRQVTTDEIVYLGFREDASLFFGTDTRGILDEGVVTLSFPLKEGRRWTSGVASFPDMFEFTVVGPETVETPAGTFDAVRVDQLNRVDSVDVARWFAPGVGLVHRVGPDGVGPTAPTARTTLVEYSLPGELP